MSTKKAPRGHVPKDMYFVVKTEGNFDLESSSLEEACKDAVITSKIDKSPTYIEVYARSVGGARAWGGEKGADLWRKIGDAKKPMETYEVKVTFARKGTPSSHR